MTTVPDVIAFSPDRPFHCMVTSFLVSAVGLGPVFEAANPLGLSEQQAAWFAGKVQPTFVIDMKQIRDMALSVGPNAALTSLCCMLVNAAYETVKTQNDHSPEFELFRHIRNAASHGNRFSFSEIEPRWAASWRGVTIDHSLKGSRNAHHGKECFGNILAPADAILLLWDMERKLSTITRGN